MKSTKSNRFILTVNDEIQMKLLDRVDAEEMFQLTLKNKKFLSQWLIWVRDVKSINDSKKKIQKDADNFYAGTSLELGIFKKDILIGRIGFISIKGFTAEIGYWLSESENGNGIITLCCKKLIDYTFTNTTIHRIVIKMDTENLKSKNVPERLNFTLEGIARGSVLLKGEYRDSFVYSLLKTDPR